MSALVELVEGVLVATSSLEQMNTTVVVGEGGGCLVVDAGGTPEEMSALAADLKQRGLRPVAGFSTHAHWRHALWHADLGDVPRYATAEAAAWADEHRADLEAEATAAGLGHEVSLLAKFTPLDEDAEALEWDGPAAAVAPLAGHAPGHAVLLLPDLEVLIAGETCSDVRVPLLDLTAEEPVDDYRNTLDVLESLEGVSQIIPGHGTPSAIDALAKRLEMDEAYISAIVAGGTSEDERLNNATPSVLAHHEEQAKFVAGKASAAVAEARAAQDAAAAAAATAAVGGEPPAPASDEPVFSTFTSPGGFNWRVKVGGKRVTAEGTGSVLNKVIDHDSPFESAEEAYNVLREQVEPPLTAIHEFSSAAKEVSDRLSQSAISLGTAVTGVAQLNQQVQFIVEALETAGLFLSATATAAAELRDWQGAADKVCLAAVDSALASFAETVQYRMWSNMSKGRMEIPPGASAALEKMKPSVETAAGPATEAVAAAVELS